MSNVDQCTVAGNGQNCYWNGSNCNYRYCTTTTLTTFNHPNCVGWMTTCTVNKPTTCLAKPTNCSDATNWDTCYKNVSEVLCAWVAGACVDKTCTNHAYNVTVFN